ncbi:MAG: hypothetical protein U5R31_00510 [Acidimicrobiia bacterium]|nr:hypothetical protein [Acidimicrobiia bacterium]
MPAEGLAQGEQLAFYNRGPGRGSAIEPAARARRIPSSEPRGPVHASPSGCGDAGARAGRAVDRGEPSNSSPGAGPSGRYRPLYEFLVRRDDHHVSLRFAELERILGASLPASARRHRPWWANTAGSHSQARAWLEAGWSVDMVDLNGGRVAFRRGR